MSSSNRIKASKIINDTDRELLAKILCEMRVQTMMLAQEFRLREDIGDLRNEVMMEAGHTLTDL